MRHGIPMAGNFLQQENVVLTGACEAIVVDVAVHLPRTRPAHQVLPHQVHHHLPHRPMPDSEYVEFHEESAAENAKAIVKMAVENFKNRNQDLVNIPQLKTNARVGYSVEAIKKELDGVCNSTSTLWAPEAPGRRCQGRRSSRRCRDGRLQQPKVRPDTAHIELMKKPQERYHRHRLRLLGTGCCESRSDEPQAAEYCGEGLKRVCKLVGIPPILHMGSCVDISRMMVLAADLAKDWGINISQIPLCGCAPEWMSEKAVSIGNYVVATGIETYLGVDPYSRVRAEVTALLQGTEGGCQEWVEAHFVVEKDIDKLGDRMIESIEAKRAALGI